MPAQILRVLFQTADDMIRALASWGADPSEADFEALQTQEWLHQMTAESVWFRARWVVPDSKDGRAALEVYTEPVGGGHRIPVRWFVKATREPADWILESIAGMDFGGDARAARDAVVAWAKSRGVRPFHSRAEQLRWLLANRVKL